jgi:hypothetical protein
LVKVFKKFRTEKLINFFSPEGYEAVAIDMLLEQGFQMDVQSDYDSLRYWVLSIRGKMDARWDRIQARAPWIRTPWEVEWTFNKIPHTKKRYAILRQGRTEDLFKSIEDLSVWSVFLTRQEQERFYDTGVLPDLHL